MTLVLSAASHDSLVMVADRRLTDVRDGRVYEELKNKLVIYSDLFVFGFTGFAHLEGQPVDEWLAHCLGAEEDFNKALQLLAERSSKALAKIQWKGPKLQAFVGLGWVRETVTGKAEPGWVCVSNAWDPDAEAWTATPNSDFRIVGRLLPPGKRWAMLPPIGVPLSVAEVAKVRARVRPAMKRRTHAFAAARLLGDALREAAEGKPTVGKNPTCVILPRPLSNAVYRVFVPPKAFQSGRVLGPTAFPLTDPAGDSTWWPPIAVQPGVMLLPEYHHAADGGAEFRYRVTTSLYRAATPEYAVGVTDGVNESMIVVGSGMDGKPAVQSGPVPEPWRTRR